MTDTAYAMDAALPLGSEADLPARTDVLVVGGGLTGASAALHLNRDGLHTTLIEQGRIGDGASGRNGGQLHPGQRRDQMWLEEHLGARLARGLWRLGEEAVALVHDLRRELGADCDWRPGLIDAAHTKAALDDLHVGAEHMARHYGVAWQPLDKESLSEAIGTTRYVGGFRDGAGGHLNPLAFVGALAQRAHVEGARLIEGARALALRRAGGEWVAKVALAGAKREVRATHIVLAGNGYMRGVRSELDARIVPLKNYIVATAPLDELLIPAGEAVADSRFVIRYFRQDAKGRMVFGGGESFSPGPRNVARFVRPYLAEVYPQLKSVPIEAAWGGTLGITRLRMPIVRRLEPGLYAGAGFSGQGLGLSVFAGKIIADAICGEASRLDVFSQIPAPAFPGGRLLQTPLAQLAMIAFAVRDRLGR